MTIVEAEARIKEEMEKAQNLFTGVNVTLTTQVENTLNETPDGTEIICLFGTVAITADGLEDDDTLLLSLEADIGNDGNVDESAFEENAVILSKKLKSIKERLCTSEDIAAEIKVINLEIDNAVEEEYKKQLERLNASTKKSVMVAAFAAVALLLIAAACILIDILAK